MAVVWMVLFPFAIYWARFVRSMPKFNRGWMWVHMSTQILGATLAIAFAMYVDAHFIVNDNL
jgi:hypothetical protein